MESTAAREAFAQRIATEARIESTALIRGLSAVPREDFVGPGPWLIARVGEAEKGHVRTPDDDVAHIYDTVLVALDADRQLNNGEPSSLLRFLDSLVLQTGEALLHIGCGVGYYTAIASVAVGPEGRVVGVEADPGLAAKAQEKLQPYVNARAICGDGSENVEGAYDAIFVNAGCTHPPGMWIDKLAIGGRLLVPLTVDSKLTNIGFGRMLLVTRLESHWNARFTSPVGIFHCIGGRNEEANRGLAEAFARRDPDSVRVLRRDEHDRKETCWLHGQGYCLSA